MRVHVFLYDIHPWLTWPGFLSVLLASVAAASIAVAAAVRSRPIGDPRWLKFLIGVGMGGVLGLAALQCAVAALYLIFPSYLDWVEPGAAAISWLVLHGSPAYPQIGAGDLYAQVYGPLLFQVTGLFLGILGPSIAVSKLPALGAFAAAQVLAYLALRRCGASRVDALTLAAAQCVIQAGFTNQAYAFGVRADPWLYLMGAAATLIAVSRPTLVNAALLGASAGFAANFKLHAVLYVVPLALFALWRDEMASRRLRVVAAGLAGFLVAFALPFAGVDAAHYLAILEASTNRGFDRSLLERNVLMIVFLLLPVAWIVVFHGPDVPRRLRAFFAATAICMLLILYPASEAGAGPHHYLPFLPSLSCAFLVLYRAAREGRPRRAALASIDASVAVLLFAIVLGYSSIDAQAWDFTVHDFGTTPSVTAATVEIDSILARHPRLTAAVGPGSDPGFDIGYMRVLPVFRGNPLPIDPVTWTDQKSEHVGARDAVVRTILRDCRVDLWLLPHAEPFDIAPGQAMFSGEVMRDFRANYELTATGPLFDQWQCNHKPDAPARP